MHYTQEQLNEHRRRCTEPREDGTEYVPTRELVLKLVEQIEKAEAAKRELENRLAIQKLRCGESDAELASVKADRDAAQAIVALLPKTADGVPVIPAISEVFHFRQDLFPGSCTVWGETVTHYGRTPQILRLSDCYSTREAALAAKH